MPLSPEQEWKASTQKCGMISLSNRHLIALRGKDKREFLQGIFSQDVKNNFPEGTVLYGLFTDLKGKILADAFVIHLSDAFFLDVPESGFSSLLKHLERYLVLLEVEIENCSEEYRFVSLIGPKAPGFLKEIFGIHFFGSQECRKIGEENNFIFPFQLREFQEYRIWEKKKSPSISRSKPADSSDSAILQKLNEAEVIPIGEKTYDTARIESGIPKFGREMDESTFPAEVGLEEYVNLRKGCFLGAEVLQRIFYQGHVNRCLVLFSCESSEKSSEEPDLAGCQIRQDNQEIGKITASAFSFHRQKPVALGLIKVAALESEASFSALWEGKTIPLNFLRTFLPSKESLEKAG